MIQEVHRALVQTYSSTAKFPLTNAGDSELAYEIALTRPSISNGLDHPIVSLQTMKTGIQHVVEALEAKRREKRLPVLDNEYALGYRWCHYTKPIHATD